MRSGLGEKLSVDFTNAVGFALECEIRPYTVEGMTAQRGRGGWIGKQG